MTQDEIIEMAKDAGLRIDVRGRYFFVGFCELSDLLDAATAKEREALEQPEQKPVAWMFQHDETGRMNYVSNDGVHNPTIFLEMNPRYALVCPLYTTPPQRTFVAGEEIDSCFENHGWSPSKDYYLVIKDIEAKLKEKNT
jgi:hypothetical protein